MALSLTITTRVSVRVAGHERKRTRRTVLALGSAAYSVHAPGAAILRIRLAGKALKLVTAARNHKLVVAATVTPSSGAGLRAPAGWRWSARRPRRNEHRRRSLQVAGKVVIRRPALLPSRVVWRSAVAVAGAD